MPLLKIQTNVTVAADAGQALVAEASSAVAALLGKPERYVMVALEPAATMAFAGDSSPLAYLEMKSVGLPQGSTSALSKALWGWNGGTF